ncbi:hypothetical protein [Parafrankia elaeagni]|uniref:hypothetical protein n=1 Tax=Parafrankia elaeagni TaxID=222534 RepID=UPI001E5B8C88|nr:hypothetical protein [Parafrankia elaeagni]
MTARGSQVTDARPDGPDLECGSGRPEEAQTLLGKRYRAPGGTFEALCVRQGAGALELDGVPLELVKPRILPASD